MKTFPQPLNSKEEEYYLNKYKEGDPKAKTILIEHNLRLVAHIVKKYQNIETDIEDLLSIGTVGLIKAVMTYDANKGSRLATYAARCIDNELLMFMRARKKVLREVSLYEPIGTDKEGNEINLIDIMETEDNSVIDEIEKKENIKKLYNLIEKCLSDREKYIINARYGMNNQSELTQREIAKELGISRTYVSRIEKHAIKKLQAGFCNNT